MLDVRRKHNDRAENIAHILSPFTKSQALVTKSSGGAHPERVGSCPLQTYVFYMQRLQALQCSRLLVDVRSQPDLLGRHFPKPAELTGRAVAPSRVLV